MFRLQAYFSSAHTGPPLRKDVVYKPEVMIN